MKNVLKSLLTTLSTIALIIAWSSEGVADEAAKSFTLQSPNGKIEKVNGKKAQKQTGLRPYIPSFKKIKSKDYLCKRLKHSETQAFAIAEMQLELEMLIGSLEEMEKPRRLSSNQKVLVSQVPFCGAFVGDLMVISKLLKGYDLVGMMSFK